MEILDTYSFKFIDNFDNDEDSDEYIECIDNVVQQLHDRDLGLLFDLNDGYFSDYRKNIEQILKITKDDNISDLAFVTLYLANYENWFDKSREIMLAKIDTNKSLIIENLGSAIIFNDDYIISMVKKWILKDFDNIGILSHDTNTFVVSIYKFYQFVCEDILLHKFVMTS